MPLPGHGLDWWLMVSGITTWVLYPRHCEEDPLICTSEPLTSAAFSLPACWAVPGFYQALICFSDPGAQVSTRGDSDAVCVAQG